VDLDQRVHKVQPERVPPVLALQSGRKVAGDDRPFEEIHHVEGDADHALVLADGADRRQPDPVRRERELEARLPDHVVCRGRKRGPRRAAEDEAVVAALEQEGEVRPAALADPTRPDRPGAETVLVEEHLDVLEDEEGRLLLGHQADWPPSTTTTWPVTKSEAREAR
jgi:hypothetical protein